MYYEMPDRDGYYSMFFLKLLINERIAKSHFPKLLKSGYWNGYFVRPMHFFEYLGKEVPEENWDKREVYSVIRSRLEDLHSLGIAHNDVRIPNIDVPESGKISLIDFGLSDSSNDEELMKNDFRKLDKILGMPGSSGSVS